MPDTLDASFNEPRIGRINIAGELDAVDGAFSTLFWPAGLSCFNVFDYRGATVIADYGHNPDAIGALVKAVEALPARRRSVVISGAGDRRDEDILGQSAILGDAFDHVILYEDQCQRGRADGEVIKLLAAGLAGAKRTRHIDEIKGEFRAIDTALAGLAPGDLCLILIDQVEEALAYLGTQVAGAVEALAPQ